MEIGVAQGLQSIIPDLASKSAAYLCWERKKPVKVGWTDILRK